MSALLLHKTDKITNPFIECKKTCLISVKNDTNYD